MKKEVLAVIIFLVAQIADAQSVCIRFASNNPTGKLVQQGCSVLNDTPTHKCNVQNETNVFGNVSRARVKRVCGLNLPSCDSKLIPEMISIPKSMPVGEVSSLIENQSYSRKFGANNLGGTLVLERKKDRHLFSASVIFLGAGLFSKALHKDVKDQIGNTVAVPAEYFTTANYDFRTNKPLHNRILSIVSTISQRFDTGFSGLNINPVFVDELKLLTENHLVTKAQIEKMSYNEYLLLLNKAAKLISTDSIKNLNGSIPVIVAAIPNPNFATPTEWDPFYPADVYAHEFGHILGINSEGYELEGYPFHGVMNGGEMFKRLTDLGLHDKIKVQKSDLNEIFIDGFGSPRKWTPEINANDVQKAYSPTTNEKYGARLPEFRSKPIIERMAIVEKELKAWLEDGFFCE